MEKESTVQICPLRLIFENSIYTGVFKVLDIEGVKTITRSYSFPIPMPADISEEFFKIDQNAFSSYSFLNIDRHVFMEKLVNIFYLIGSLYDKKLIKPKIKGLIDKKDFSNYEDVLKIYLQLLKSPSISKYIEIENDNILYQENLVLSYFCLTLLGSYNENKLSPVVSKSYFNLIRLIENISDNLSLNDYFSNINDSFFEDNNFKKASLLFFLESFEKKYFNIFKNSIADISLKEYLLEELKMLDINNTSFIDCFEPLIAKDLLNFTIILDKLKKGLIVLNNLDFCPDSEDDLESFDDIEDNIIFENQIEADKLLLDSKLENAKLLMSNKLELAKAPQFLYPLRYEDHILLEEKNYLKEALISIYEKKEADKYIDYFFYNKNICRNDKKILKNNCYPSEVVVYKNYSYSTILSYLKPLSVEQSSLQKLKDIKINYPHFCEIIDYLEVCLKMNMRNDNTLKFKPILILGNNGLGKSAFIDEINNIFNMSNNAINIGNMSTPSEISGSSSLWSTGQPGFVSKTVIRNKCYNPIIVLEELDKVVTGSSNGRIMSPLYDLLEQRSAEDFYENFFSVSFDFSYVNYIATANTLENIDKGIISRFRVFTVQSPKEEELPAIVKSVYLQLKKDSLFDLVAINDIGLKAISNAFSHERIYNVRKIYKFMEDLLMDAAQFNDSNDVYVIDYLDDGYISHSTTLH